MILPLSPRESHSCKMFSSTSVLNKPLSFLRLKPPPKPSSNLVVFPGNFVLFSRKNRVWGKYTMRTFTKAQVTRRRESGDGFIDTASGFEQEGFIDGSSGIRSTRHVAGRLDVTMNRLGKWIVSAIFGALVLLRHDGEVVWFAMGSVLNVLLSLTLKQTLKQERPASALRSGHGMPSSHAQSIFFAVVFFIVSMVEWLGLNAATTLLGGVVLAFGLYFSWLRVSLHYHTVSQVGVGAMVGSIFSILWFLVWNVFVSKAFISSLWFGIVVVLGAFGFVLGFLLLVLLYCWLNQEN